MYWVLDGCIFKPSKELLYVTQRVNDGIPPPPPPSGGMGFCGVWQTVIIRDWVIDIVGSMYNCIICNFRFMLCLSYKPSKAVSIIEVDVI